MLEYSVGLTSEQAINFLNIDKSVRVIDKRKNVAVAIL